jgi:hypothetical protein
MKNENGKLTFITIENKLLSQLHNKINRQDYKHIIQFGMNFVSTALHISTEVPSDIRLLVQD